jgi:hypothetical protein
MITMKSAGGAAVRPPNAALGAAVPAARRRSALLWSFDTALTLYSCG